ncbi:MAG: hypothetical protein HQM10_00015 [Candidatus Riflebacteria bacterium]|nr:hypothetical protein [Candidatus Riflebacteria bacterium]
MKSIYKKFGILLFAISFSSGLNAKHLEPPRIVMLLEKDNKASENCLTGFLESIKGDLTSIEVEFESSPDILVVTPPQKFKSIQQGQSKFFPVEVEKTLKQASENGSWVKMIVKYHPDYLIIPSGTSEFKTCSDGKDSKRLNKESFQKNNYSDSFTDEMRFFID